MKKIISLTLVFFSTLITPNAWAKLNVVTTLPNFAYLAREIGGDQVQVKSMLGTTFDPHFIEAKPSFITLLSRADLLISNGLELEVGFLPVLIDQASNPKIRDGHAGSLVLGNLVPVIELPQGKVSRDMGDIHPYGNPHFYTSPALVPVMAKAVAEKLIALDAKGSPLYQNNLTRFLARWQKQEQLWKQSVASLGKQNLIAYHKSLNYLVEWLGWNLADTIESKPGVPASSSRVSQLVDQTKNKNVSLILQEDWYPDKDARFISEKSGVPHLAIAGLTDDYFEYFDTLFATFKNQLKKP